MPPGGAAAYQLRKMGQQSVACGLPRLLAQWLSSGPCAVTVPCSFAPRSTVLVEAGSQPWGCVLLCLLRQVLKSKSFFKRKKNMSFGRLWPHNGCNSAILGSVLKELIGRSDGQLTFLFADSSGNTLQRHLSGWKRWLEFCRCGHFSCRASVVSIARFPRCSGYWSLARSDRGRQRVSHAKGNVSAMKFAAYKLELQALSCMLEHAAVASWLKSKKRWASTASHQVLPLPLSVARKFENKRVCSVSLKTFLIWTFLLMLWGALRWSDVQRIDFSTLVLDKVSLRGWSWRTKTSVTGMPSGVLVSGIEESDWGQALGEQLLKMSKEDPCRDFLVGSRGANQLHFNVVSISTLSSSVWRRGAGRRFSLFFA